MYVRFYVLNHSKYRFPFHAVYIGIMTGIRKPTFHAARYNRLKYLGSDVRSRPLQSAPRACFGARTVIILQPGTAPAPEAVTEDFRNFGQRFSGADFCFRQKTASCTFVRQIGICPTKVLALRGRGRSPVAALFLAIYEYQPKTDRHDRQEAPNAEL